MNLLKVVLITAFFVTAPTWAESLTGPQKNAVRSAKQYLIMQGFSCKGLIDQLSSSYGEGYTESQANYGARQTDAC